MSIAEEESTRKYYLLEGPEHGEGLREKLLDAALENRHVIAQREAYVAGRTADPTEEEVKAVADELAAWNFDVAMNSGATIHGATADFSSRSFELLAKRVLNAASKAVAESRERES